MTQLNYLENTYNFESDAKIIETGENEFGKYIILDKTIFYPQGGGQPSDIGKIIFGDKIFEVENVRLDDKGIVFHYGKFSLLTEGFYPLQKVKLNINSEIRIKNAKNHTGGHLLDIAVKNMGLNLIAKKGFHFDTGCYVEYSGIYNVEEKEEILKKLNLEINNLISQNLKINIDNNLDGNHQSTPGKKCPWGEKFLEKYILKTMKRFDVVVDELT
ncbi:MAG: alanine--tRNA ligase-related protein [Candidatus Gracilibacteria bacterium]|nr:alanine--tRNA ligase-related protein [Candidatus Gracilibacteria bacterium]MDQ7022351.1 alanine--tRNA ligase-related protein [Candidatus Gracilibacteria bacterium]